MALMDLTELNSANSWEYNGYDDSDWYTVYFNTETKLLQRELRGTTRFAALHITPEGVEPWTEEAKVEAKQALVTMHFNLLRQGHTNRVNAPHDAPEGTRVVLLEDHRNQNKAEAKEPCRKCNGTGNWVNPNIKTDVRPCFNCNGTGEFTTFARAKGMRTIPAGTTGTVVWQGTFATIYRNGYNKLGRSTLTCRVQEEDGTVFNAPLSKLSLDEEVPSDERIMQEAVRRAESWNAYPFFPSDQGGAMALMAMLQGTCLSRLD